VCPVSLDSVNVPLTSNYAIQAIEHDCPSHILEIQENILRAGNFCVYYSTRNAKIYDMVETRSMEMETDSR
jgi:hypothetical protein